MAKILTEEQKKYQKIERGKEYRSIKASLLDQLERAGNNTEFYINLVGDYMDMYVTKELLNEDVRERGVRVYYDNGGGQRGYKKNESIDQALKVNAQMLKLLTELDITPSMEGGEEYEL